MSTLSPFHALDSPFAASLQWARRRLSRAGLRVMRTFDLNATRARHEVEDCPCPNHGTEACDCQMVILLVYGSAESPATLVLHGNDGQTWLSIADEPRQRLNPKLLAGIRQALNAPVSIPQDA